ncbi:MAG: energy-coupled thiamine transporter ThiT [Aerococcus sp.]|nr:energy-coupled thiamine transporter ThiT [Aerococcus sp.]
MRAADRIVTFVEGLLLTALAFLVQFVFPAMVQSWDIILMFGGALVILYALRRGPLPGFFSGALLGCAQAIMIEQPKEHIAQIVGLILATSMLGLAGYFARNLQRTLHNHRMFSVYLNLVTGVIVSVLAFFIVRFVVMQYFDTSVTMPLMTGLKQNSWSFLVNVVLILLILIVLLNTMTKAFIPKNTPYISRKERSRLLND